MTLLPIQQRTRATLQPGDVLVAIRTPAHAKEK
jgi:hypothetical protein